MEKENKESYSTLKSMSNALSEAGVEKFQGLVSDILEGIEEAKEPNKSIPETVFKYYFLPLFQDIARDKTKENSKENKNKLSAWIELANGPFNEVDVIDDVKGEVLFTVPSLFVKNAVVLEKVRDFNFSGMGNAYEAKASVNPFQAENYINSSLASVPKFIQDPKANTDDQERWTKIFKRYVPAKKKEELITKPVNCNGQQVKKRIKEDLGVDLGD